VGIGARSASRSGAELGGSDPFIVMPSADLEAAISTAVIARVQNNGQSCIAAKRLLWRSRLRTSSSEVVARMEGLRVGDPFDEKTELGPLATRMA